MVATARRAARFGVLPLLVCSLAACGAEQGTASAGEGEGTPTRLRPELVIFVFDRSTSITGFQLDIARQLTNDRIRTLDHDDRISAHQILQLSLSEPPLRWSETVPGRRWEQLEMMRDSVTRARFLKDAMDYLVVFSDTLNREDINGTDILSTFHDVAADLLAAGNRSPTMYIFSDMLQSNRVIDMEGLNRMPPADYVRRQKQQGTLPDLSGLCVVALGARVDTPASQRVLRFWKEYFEATGAILEDHNYMLRPVSLPVDPCGSA